MFTQDSSLRFPAIQQLNLTSGRVYKVGSIMLPSITRVLGSQQKPWLEDWKERVGVDEAAKISARATYRGMALHRLCENFLSNKAASFGDTARVPELWASLRPWLEEHVTKVYAQEQDLYSEMLSVAGRTDLIADIDGVFSVVDFKQANKPKKNEWITDYKLQGTFYACAVYEHTRRLPEQIVFPIASPEGLQVFTADPNQHLTALRERIATFYMHYDEPAVA